MKLLQLILGALGLFVAIFLMLYAAILALVLITGVG
jgi:hypothetical protein